jgi:hypothetical protein
VTGATPRVSANSNEHYEGDSLGATAASPGELADVIRPPQPLMPVSATPCTR